MLILICNAGSTSLKYKLYEMPGLKVIAEAKMDRIGTSTPSTFEYKNNIKNSTVKIDNVELSCYEDGIKLFNKTVLSQENGVISSLSQIDAIGFKTVIAKGYTGVHLIDEPLMQGMREFLNIAPVHNKAYIEAIEAMQKLMGDTPMVGVFEPHFHYTIPEYARVYGIPYNWTQEYGVKRYGYHSSSHRHMALRSKEYVGENAKVVSCHLGGSSSISAIKDGKSLDNSWGFTLQSGTLHGTRTGDLDPFVPLYMQKMGMSMEEVYNALIKDGGLLGISGVSEDMRDIEQAAAAGNERAKLALDVYAYGIVKYIGSYYALMGGVDLLIFTGGIGENSAVLRKKVVSEIGCLKDIGFILSDERNENLKRGAAGIISADDSKVKIAVIPTNEEYTMVNEIFSMLNK